MADFATTLPINYFDLKFCKLPTSERRAATTATETTFLSTRQYVLTPTYVPGCCTETDKLLQVICNSCFLMFSVLSDALTNATATALSPALSAHTTDSTTRRPRPKTPASSP